MAGVTRDARALVGVRAQVIPDDWEAHHQPTVRQTFTAAGDLLSGGTGQWVYDEATGTEVRDYGTAIYSGPLRFQHLNNPKDKTAGGQQVTLADYMVSVPEEVDSVESIGWVRITGSSDGSARMLKVTGIIRGSLRWQRDLLATDNIG